MVYLTICISFWLAPQKRKLVFWLIWHNCDLYLFDWDHWLVVKDKRKTWWKSYFWFGHLSFIVIETIGWLQQWIIKEMHLCHSQLLNFISHYGERHIFWPSFNDFLLGNKQLTMVTISTQFFHFSCKQKCPSLGRGQGWFCSSVILLDLNSPYNVWLKKKISFITSWRLSYCCKWCYHSRWLRLEP